MGRVAIDPHQEDIQSQESCLLWRDLGVAEDGRTLLSQARV